MKKLKLNVKLLEKIKKHLKEEPKRYHQGKWVEEVSVWDANAPACGTVGCIAGWAVLLSVPKKRWSFWFRREESIKDRASKLLGLDYNQTNYLFAAGNQMDWTGPAGVAEACKKIDHIIKGKPIL